MKTDDKAKVTMVIGEHTHEMEATVTAVGPNGKTASLSLDSGDFTGSMALTVTSNSSLNLGDC